jgi:hypothetical protein
MKLKVLLSIVILTLYFQAQAQDASLPDQPLDEDILSFEAENANQDVENSPVAEPSASVVFDKAKPAVESAPQEPPFTQEQDEFEDALADEKAPVIEAPPAESPYRPAERIGVVKKGIERIEHPLAAKGLMRIEKDGSYIYRTKPLDHNQSASFRIGVIQPPNIQSADGQTDFKTMYTEENIPTFMFDYEWQPFTGFGKLGVQAGVGFFTSEGKGRFLLDGEEAKEKYTFYAFPVNLGVIYRLEFSSKQWLAPYIAGGGTYFALVEMRDDDAKPHGVGTPAAYGAGGMMFNSTEFQTYGLQLSIAM